MYADNSEPDMLRNVQNTAKTVSYFIGLCFFPWWPVEHYYYQPLWHGDMFSWSLLLPHRNMHHIHSYQQYCSEDDENPYSTFIRSQTISYSIMILFDRRKGGKRKREEKRDFHWFVHKAHSNTHTHRMQYKTKQTNFCRYLFPKKIKSNSWTKRYAIKINVVRYYGFRHHFSYRTTHFFSCSCGFAHFFRSSVSKYAILFLFYII